MKTEPAPKGREALLTQLVEKKNPPLPKYYPGIFLLKLLVFLPGATLFLLTENYLLGVLYSILSFPILYLRDLQTLQKQRAAHYLKKAILGTPTTPQKLTQALQYIELEDPTTKPLLQSILLKEKDSLIRTQLTKVLTNPSLKLDKISTQEVCISASLPYLDQLLEIQVQEGKIILVESERKSPIQGELPKILSKKTLFPS